MPQNITSVELVLAHERHRPRGEPLYREAQILHRHRRRRRRLHRPCSLLLRVPQLPLQVEVPHPLRLNSRLSLAHIHRRPQSSLRG